MSKIVGHPLLALGPRNGFDFDSTALTIHASHGVLKENPNTPERDVLKETRGGVVIGRPLARAARANRAVARMRTQAKDQRLVSVRKKVVVEDKSLEVDDGVE